jgi:hypothetical protein
LLANFLNRKNRLEAYNMGNKLYNVHQHAGGITGMVLPIQKGNETVQIIDMLEGYEARGRRF